MKWNAENERDETGFKPGLREILKRAGKSVAGPCFLLVLAVNCATVCSAQTSTDPFTVVNPKHKKWPMDEASRIYLSACQYVARAIRPEKPPHLLPVFVLVLGTEKNEVVRGEGNAEIHLKNWDPGAFAEAVVIMASREILTANDLRTISREVLLSAEATVSVRDLQQTR